MAATLLKKIDPAELTLPRRSAIDPRALADAQPIVDAVRERGWAAALEYAARFGEIDAASERLVFDADALADAAATLPTDARNLLARTAERIEAFARAQRDSLNDLNVTIPGGSASHRVVPVERAGCYAPGGRYPLPSSVLMTAIAARAAGVHDITVASPRPTVETLAAASIAGADRLIGLGGAHAIALLAHGADAVAMDARTERLHPCDVIVGPGNKWVTAAKFLVSQFCGIDMLAGPSELLIVADGSADVALIAADLLAQAEHDDDAIPMVVTTDASLAPRLEAELTRQLHDLPTADTARTALANGFLVVVESLEQAVALAQTIAPEHLQLSVQDAPAVADRFTQFGGLFVGEQSAEVLGDYGAGPNHTLPTGGAARFASGLSVFHFLRVQTRLLVEEPIAAHSLHADAVRLARIEGLEAHARAVEARQQ